MIYKTLSSRTKRRSRNITSRPKPGARRQQGAWGWNQGWTRQCRGADGLKWRRTRANSSTRATTTSSPPTRRGQASRIGAPRGCFLARATYRARHNAAMPPAEFPNVENTRRPVFGSCARAGCPRRSGKAHGFLGGSPAVSWRTPRGVRFPALMCLVCGPGSIIC